MLLLLLLGWLAREAIRELSATCWLLDATEINLELGNPILTNMIMIGVLVQTNVVNLSQSDMEAMIRETFPGKGAQMNITAATRGMQAVQSSNRLKTDSS